MNRFQPALFGGLLIGVLSSTPLIKSGNVCCCLWVVCGGVLATYLLQQRTAEPIQVSDAMLQGIVAGLIGGLVYLGVTAVLFDVTRDLLQGPMQQAMDRPDFPPEAREFMTKLMTGHNVLFLVAIVQLPTYAIFSMLGSLLGVAIFKKKAAAPPAAQA